jgi:cytochrome b pre-mRNA-processing protein 3
LALDYGLLTSDAELAGAVWRNFLGARGAMGINGRGQAINYAGLGSSTNRINLPRDPEADDKSGVRDFEGADIDKYVQYPELMWTLVSYIRREVARLEAIPDEAIIQTAFTGSFGAIHENEDPIPPFN